MPYTEPDLARAALLTIDVQRDFALPGAPAEAAGATAVVPHIVRLTEAFRAAGLPIVHIVRLYESDGSNADICRRGAILNGLRIVCPGSPGAEPVSEIMPPDAGLDFPLLLGGGIQTLGPGESVIYKPRWGAFYRTPLKDHLDGLQVNTLVVCGLNFPNCPRTTVYEASERDYRLIMVEDAVSGIYRRGREELRAIGVRLRTARAVIAALAGVTGIPARNAESDSLSTGMKRR